MRLSGFGISVFLGLSSLLISSVNGIDIRINADSSPDEHNNPEREPGPFLTAIEFRVDRVGSGNEAPNTYMISSMYFPSGLLLGHALWPKISLFLTFDIFPKLFSAATLSAPSGQSAQAPARDRLMIPLSIQYTDPDKGFRGINDYTIINGLDTYYNVNGDPEDARGNWQFRFEISMYTVGPTRVGFLKITVTDPNL